MNLFIKGVQIADPGSPSNQQICDLRVENGLIAAIGQALKPAANDTVFEAEGMILSPGFFDLNCSVGDPGLETREDLSTATAAAAAGGFTGIAVLPVARPVVQSKGQVEYILNKTRNNLVQVCPLGAISHQLEGKELAEMYDMKMAGAVAFTDADRPITDDGFMSRALQYVKSFGALLMLYPENTSLAGKSQIHESANSILLGMKGIPALAEEMHIARDIFLAAYHDAPLHIQTLSTAGAVALIRRAKKDGLKISCDVAAHQLVFTEEQLNDFDSHYKVKPPLRSKSDVKALLAGLRDGTIDAVCTQHRPHEVEFKRVEFEHAAYGITGLQTALPFLLKAGLDAAQIADKLAIQPRKILQLPVPVIQQGEKANFTIYDPGAVWTLNRESNFSKAENSPVFNQPLKGKVQLVYNHDQFKRYE